MRHRLGSGVDLVAGGIGLGASAERLRDRSPPAVSTVGFSAQEFAAGSGAAQCISGGRGSPPPFTELTGGDLTAARNPAKGELLSPSNGASAISSCEPQFAQQARPERDGVHEVRQHGEEAGQRKQAAGRGAAGANEMPKWAPR